MFGLAVLDVDPGQAGRGGQAQLPGEVTAASRPQTSKHWGAGQGGRVSEHLRAAGPGQGVRPRRGHRVGEHELTLHPLARHGGHWAGGGQGGAGVAVLSHPLGELIEVRADDEGELRPTSRGLGARPGLPSGQRLVPGLRPGQRPGVVTTGAEHSVLVQHWVVHLLSLLLPGCNSSHNTL